MIKRFKYFYFGRTSFPYSGNHNTDEEVSASADFLVNLNVSHFYNLKLDICKGIRKSDLPPLDEKYELHRLLCALFSNELTLTQKLDIIETEYKIPLDQTLREDVNVMCNLGEGIRERALKDGIKTGIQLGEQNIVLHMFQKGYTTAQIADIAGLEELKIKTIIEENELATV